MYADDPKNLFHRDGVPKEENTLIPEISRRMAEQIYRTRERMEVTEA